ncbi:MAG: phosphatidate cytidylyltransferase [Spirochaetales bacterium]|nr:MAG: phosphatidate cytidylyltransferase [Spirochaetales bacterium]
MGKLFSNVITDYISRAQNAKKEIEVELLRKSIHALIAFVPVLASLNSTFTMVLLGTGIVLYAFSETLRVNGRKVAVISTLTVAASREKDSMSFVLGPVTLVIGAMAALLFYPEPAASIAIYALAFGDSVSSIFGKVFGRVRIAFLNGKTLAGSLACLVTVFAVTYRITGLAQASLIIGLAAALFEAAPTGDMDNIIIPIGTGFFAYMLL